MTMLRYYNKIHHKGPAKIVLTVIKKSGKHAMHF